MVDSTIHVEIEVIIDHDINTQKHLSTSLHHLIFQDDQIQMIEKN